VATGSSRFGTIALSTNRLARVPKCSFETSLRLRGDPACGEGKPRALRCRGLRLRALDFHPRLGPPGQSSSEGASLHRSARGLPCRRSRR
jgi:hypothetical protein